MLLLALPALALLSAATQRLMIRRGVMDVPGFRSSHAAPTPKGGGIGIALAFALAVLGAGALGDAGNDPLRPAALLAAGLLLAAVSWADDVGPLAVWTKFAAQLGASLLLMAGGFVVHALGPWPLGPLAGPLTLGWMLFTINAVNFIDGLNGLASGACAIVAVAVAAVTTDAALRAALLGLAAGIAGFLPFNIPRARIFMGDVGSQLCGLLVAAAAAAPSLPGEWTALLAPLGLFAVLADVAVTLLRRARAGDRLAAAHRGHLYQLAHRSGVPAMLVTAIYWGFALWGSVLGIVSLDATTTGIAAAIALAAAPFAVWALTVRRMARTAPIGRW